MFSHSLYIVLRISFRVLYLSTILHHDFYRARWSCALGYLLTWDITSLELLMSCISSPIVFRTLLIFHVIVATNVWTMQGTTCLFSLANFNEPKTCVFYEIWWEFITILFQVWRRGKGKKMLSWISEYAEKESEL